MRIAQISPPWLSVPPKGYGGVELIVALLADGLVERGHDVTLFATGDSITKASLDFVFPTAPGSKAINDPRFETVHTLHAFRDTGRFDLFHVHSPYSALAVGSVLGVPVVHTIHNAFTPEMRLLYSEVEGRVWFVAISEAHRAQMPELNYAGVVYNGIDLAAYPFDGDKEDFLLFLGRATQDKGVLRAVRAAREAGMPLALVTKIAEPAERDYWENVVVPELGSDVTVLGEVTTDAKLQLLHEARAVLFPIDWEEPFGLVMTEAMACGTPVIATPRGSVPEIVADGETGFIVSGENYPTEATRAIAELDQIDPAACRKRVEAMFSKEAMVEGYERIFKRVLE
ncbi:MAG TPA: glycosyltransferase family 4 protein [Actinomycetota bacterium]|nr:glycosyltransferase family 4 protein [Actinomycetota bacterium]